MLPAGVGEQQPVVMVSSSFFSPLTKLIACESHGLLSARLCSNWWFDVSDNAPTITQLSVSAALANPLESWAGPGLPCRRDNRTGITPAEADLSLVDCHRTARPVLTVMGDSFGSEGAIVFIGTTACAATHEPEDKQVGLPSRPCF